MFKILSVFFIFVFFTSSYSQTNKALLKRLERIEKQLDSLKIAFQIHNKEYDHDKIKFNEIRSRLALELNRNFTYAAFVYEEKPDLKEGKGFQRIFYFFGYSSEIDHEKRMKYNQAEGLKAIRQNLLHIVDIITENQKEPITFENGYTFFPPRVIIKYYDNASFSNEPFIIADSFKKTLQVRINGILKEVGWH